MAMILSGVSSGEPAGIPTSSLREGASAVGNVMPSLAAPVRSLSKCLSRSASVSAVRALIG